MFQIQVQIYRLKSKLPNLFSIKTKIFLFMIERILQFINYKGVSKLSFYREVGLSNGFLDRSKSIGVDNLVKILKTYPEIDPLWLLLGEGDMLKRGEQVQTNNGNNNTLNNINGSVKGDISISHNELSEFIEVQKDLNEIIKTSQSQLTESQKQINTLLEIIKNK